MNNQATTAIKKKRPYRAVHNRHHVDGLLQKFLRCYANDPRFRKRLLDFAQQYEPLQNDLRPFFIYEPLGLEQYQLHYRTDWESIVDEATYGEIPAVKDYVNTVHALADETGLNFLPRNRGHAAIHLWYCNTLIYSDRTPEDFGLFVDTTMVALDPPEGTVMTDKGRSLRVSLEFQGTWKWFSESPGEARERLVKEFRPMIAQEIDRLAALMEQADYMFPRDRGELDTHLRWLYRRVAYRERCNEIAGQDIKHERGDHSPEHIEQSSRKLAREMSVKIPRPCI